MLSPRTGLGLGLVTTGRGLGLVAVVASASYSLASWPRGFEVFCCTNAKDGIFIQNVDTDAVACVHSLQYSNCQLPQWREFSPRVGLS